MMGRNLLWRRSWLWALLLFAFLPGLRAATEWQVVKVGKWDYLTVENVAKFYGFSGDVEPINRTIRLDSGRNQLELTLDSREAIVNGVRNWLCFPITLNHDGKYLISRIDLAKTIEPQFRPHMIKDLGHLKTVVIDPGHGGVENGASSSYGNEKEFTLDVALKLRPLLQAKGFNVVMTREKDELVPLPERARIANATKDSIFISIHFNATDYNSSATGFEIYSLTPRGAPSTQDNTLQERFLNMQAGSPVDAQSLVLSTAVYHAMLGYMPEFDRGVKRARFAVLRLTNIPAILVEGGFLTEHDESHLIARPEWRMRLAQAISVGLESYRNLVEKKQRPFLLADYRRQLDGVLVAHNANAPAEGVASSPVFPASNQLAPSAQVTQPLRHEPSEQIVLTQQPETPSRNSASAPASLQGESEAQEESGESVAKNRVSTPNESVPPNESATPAEASVEMPDASEPIATPAAKPIEPSPPPQVRKYWVLKLGPLPKFRE